MSAIKDKIKLKDVEFNVYDNIPIENDYFISDVNLDSNGMNIYIMIKINETIKTHYIKGFDLEDVVKYLNELFEYFDDFILNSPLFNINKGFLAVINLYYKDNKNKKHKNKQIWNTMEEVYRFINYGEIINVKQKDIDYLLNWLNTMMNYLSNEKYYNAYYSC